MLVLGSLLSFVACCSLRVLGLLVVVWLLFFVCLLFIGECCLLFVVGYSFVDACFSLSNVDCSSLCVVRCALFVVCC